RKNGTSAPISAAICGNILDVSTFQSLERPKSATAAFDEPPPSPPGEGIRLSRWMRAPLSTPVAARRLSAALKIKLSLVVGILGSEHVSESVSDASNSMRSQSDTV